MVYPAKTTYAKMRGYILTAVSILITNFDHKAFSENLPDFRKNACSRGGGSKGSCV